MKKSRALSSDIVAISCTLRPSTRHSNASGLSREPPQAVHGVYARYRDSSTRTCILYDFVSSHSKKRRAPYQTFFSHLPSPSITHLRCTSLSWYQGVSSGMPRFFANFTMSSWHSAYVLVCQGFTAPPASVLVSSGITRP